MAETETETETEGGTETIEQEFADWKGRLQGMLDELRRREN